MIATSERSLIEVLDGLTEQLKTSTKDITTALATLTSAIKEAKQEIHTDLAALTKAIDPGMSLTIIKVITLLEKEIPQLRSQISDLTSTLKRVFEIQVLPIKETKKK